MCKLTSINTNYGAQVQVADIKSACIENIISLAQQCNHISEIILFGSALEERCTANSDIDIAIVSEKSIGALSKYKGFSNMHRAIYTFDMSQEYDMLYFGSIDKIIEESKDVSICRELVRKGRIIYRRDKNDNTDSLVHCES